MTKYIDYAVKFLCWGLLTTFIVQLSQNYDSDDSVINYYDSGLFSVPMIFFGLFLICAWLAFWEYYDHKPRK